MQTTEQALLNIIIQRIKKYEDEIESFEMNDTSFINAKQIKHLNVLIRELRSIKTEYCQVLIDFMNHTAEEIKTKQL